jgi:hypothetical protein
MSPRFQTGPTRAQVKTRASRAEQAVIQRVRRAVAARDGYCRLSYAHAATRRQVAQLFGACVGRSQWSHDNRTHRRSQTRGMPAEARHHRRHSLMLCAYHSAEYDQHRMDIEELTPEGCDGPLKFIRNGTIWEEQ